MIKTKHIRFTFPYSQFGQQPKCEICKSENPLKLAVLQAQSAAHIVCYETCSQNEAFGVTMGPAIPFRTQKEGSNSFIHNLIPVPTEEIKKAAEKLEELKGASKESDESAKINLQLQQQQLDKQSIDQLSKDAINELLKKMEKDADFLPRIPTRFNITNKELYRINNQPYAVQHFANEISKGLMKYDANTKSLSTEDQVLKIQLQNYLNTPVSYENIFREAIEFDHRYEMLQNKMKQEEKDSKLIYVRSSGKTKYFEFVQVGWNRYNTINNVKVQLGDFVEVQLIYRQQTYSFKCSVGENNNILSLKCNDAIPFDLLRKFKEAVDIEIEGIKFSEVAQESVLQNAVIFKNYDVWRLLGTLESDNPEDKVRILYQKNDDESTVKRQKQALKTIENNAEKVPLYKLLVGKFENNIDDQIKKLSQNQMPKCNVDAIIGNIKQLSSSQLNQTPNEAQEAAIKSSLQSCLTMIQGCPGGGKTYTAACILSGLVQIHQQGQKKAKILCCAGSNIAADNIGLFCKKMGLNAMRVYPKSLEDINFEYKKLQEIKDINMSKIISEKLENGEYVQSRMITDDDAEALSMYIIGETLYEDWKANQTKELKLTDDPYEMLQDLEKYEIEQHEIIISTCSSAGHERFKISFDAVLLDESAQSIEPESLIPISRTQKQLIIIGDQNQQGPNVSFPRLNEAGLSRGLYQRLFLVGLRPNSLNIQYRMHSGLLNFPNSNFYLGNIQPGIVDSSRSLQMRAKHPFGISRFIDQNFPSLFLNVDGKEEQIPISKSFINNQESEIVQQLVRMLLFEYNIKNKDIGIITPYSAQQLQITKDMEKIASDPANAIEVNSVDGFQGREKEIIIFSAVRTGNLGFLHDRRRLNVTMTRARRLFIIIGNGKALQNCEIWNKMWNYYLSKNAVFTGTCLKDLVKMEKPKKEKDEEK